MTTPIDMPDDDTIAHMAKVIHEEYRNDDGYELSQDHPADKPWSDLAPELQAQNFDQARDNIAKLGEIGIEVVAAGTAGASPLALSPEEVTRLAKLEHDRWTDQKRAQGYVWGESRCDDPPDLRHPSLVPWEELSKAEQNKDKGPMQRLPKVLEAAGLAVRRHDHR